MLINSDSKTSRGAKLNLLWKVGAKHALYRKDGTWYHLLKAFPGALFDENGYLLFNTEAEYRESPYLHLKKETTVRDRQGISVIPGYIRRSIHDNDEVIENSSSILDIKKHPPARKKRTLKTPKASDMPEGNEETERVLSQSYRIVRDTKVSRWVKNIHGHKCQLCEETIQLPNGEFYSEAHHIQPLGKRHKGPDIVANVICVCPKHHVLLDYGVISLDKTELRVSADHSVSDTYISYHNINIHNKS